MKTKKRLLSILLSLALVLGMLPGMSLTAYAINGDYVDVTITTDTSEDYTYAWGGKITINQGATFTNTRYLYIAQSLQFYVHGKLVLNCNDGEWRDDCYVNVYLNDGGSFVWNGYKFPYEDHSYFDPENPFPPKIDFDVPAHVRFYGFNAGTDGNGTVTVSKNNAAVESTTQSGYSDELTFTATPTSGCEFKNWTKGAGGEVLGTDASINVTCGQNGQYQVYANFISNKTAQTITASDVTATYGDTGKKVSATTTGDGGLSYVVKSGDAVTVDASGNLTIVKAGSAVITVTAAETDTYEQAIKDVNVTVNTKAMTVSAEDVNVTVDGQPHGITVNVTDPASGATVKYGTEEDSYTLDASPTQTEVGEKTVYYQVTADNYTTYTGSAKVTVSAKSAQTITASDVTATYGDTGKSIEASTTGDGGLSYVVKSGDAVTVNETTGALTIVKAGSAVITVTASETATYTQATKDVTVTINKANAVAATVTANNRTYDGTEKPLVTVTGQPTGGTMQYALGTATEATEQYTTSIPAKADAGTYYVWYMAKGDENHNNSEADCIPVTITATYTVTYKVVGGTWSDGTTADKTETVASGSKPASVPTGMKAAEGYTGGAWDTSPADATITGATTFTYTFTAVPTYTVTYKVVNGTWSDGSTTDKTETVQSGSKPASVPTGMIASSGYTGGAWDTNPAEATITEAKTFTYTFTTKQAATVTKAPTAKTLTYTGAAQELVTAGEADGGTMQYALGTATEATEPYTTSIPAKTDAGTYYVWYQAAGDENHIDSEPAAVTVTISNPEPEPQPEPPAHVHTPVTDPAKAPTCVDTGLTEGSHCSGCGAVLATRSVVPATGEHAWDEGKVTTAATVFNTGIKTFTCTVCGATKAEEYQYENTVTDDTAGWKKTNDGWMYGLADGTAAVGTKAIEGKNYVFDEKGIMQTGFTEVGGFKFYAEDDGSIPAYGWQQIDGNWYYIIGKDEKTQAWDAETETTRTQVIPSGSLATDWLLYNGEWYYLDNGTAKMEEGWITWHGKQYFLNENGVMQTGWLKYKDNWYLLRPGGSMVTGWYAESAGKWYYFGDSGAMATGWKKIKGTWYYFNDEGIMQTGWFEDKAAEKKFKAKKEMWYWLGNDGAMVTGWQEINGKWEEFDEDGLWIGTWDGK